MIKRISSLVAFLIAVFTLAGTQVATADDSPGKTLVGAWEVLITNNVGLPPAVDIAVVNRDGTMSNSDAVLGTGHGAWKRIGNSRFSYKFKTPVLVTNLFGFPPGSMLTVSGTLTVDAGGMTASGPYDFVVISPFGDVLLAFDGIVFFSRILPDY
jgi:hypothetical protein